jgi:hypothetical protein
MRTTKDTHIRFSTRFARWPSRSSRAASLALPIAVALLSFGAAPAGASSEIEHVWSFNGGEVAIASLHETLEGVVVSPTKFAECAHQAGEHMWTDMMLQPNGSYWGLHRWLYQGSCLPNPQGGPTAWRVLRKPDGSKYLLVCFSEPGSSLQPTIEPTGATAHWTYGCAESAPTAPLPVVSGAQGSGERGAEQISFPKTVVLPRASVCVKGHSLRLKLHDPKRDPLEQVVAKVGPRTVADVRGVARLRKDLVIQHLPSGTYTLAITATTVLDQQLTGRRTYSGCGKAGPGAVRLHRHHHPHPHR